MQKTTRNSKSKKQSEPSAKPPSPDDYQMVLCWSEPDQCYVVTLPAWPNARTHGTTPTEAVQNGRDVLSLLIKSAKRHGEVIPPRLNQWIMTKLAG